ncbi:MAG: HNH endonuclease [Treponema sp.]|nr:HNH endonuclease [Treponema sp.]
MSITVKKVMNNYIQEENQKVIYVHNLDRRFRFSTRDCYMRINQYWEIRLFINNDEIEMNKVMYFNRNPLYDSSNRLYIILFNDSLYQVTLNKSESEYELKDLAILIKEKIYKENKKFEQIKKQVELYEKFEEAPQPEKREPIPEDVKFEVWRRDGGKCVICGSQKNLEFDHIIPFSKGGSSTARNLQLLCQDCNRHKSDKI